MKFNLLESAGAGRPAKQEDGIERPSLARSKVVPPEPKTENDSVWIAPIGYSESRPYEVAPDHWEPHGSVLPDRHSLCLVIFDQHQDAWIVGWEGTRTGSLLTGHGAPDATVGLERDVYLDLGSLNLYGPRDAAGAWPELARLDPFGAPFPDDGGV